MKKIKGSFLSSQHVFLPDTINKLHSLSAFCEESTDQRMGWSVEAIIALVTLLVTGPASLLLLWNYFKNRNRLFLRSECFITYYKSKWKES
jgi:hypothetical protein